MFEIVIEERTNFEDFIMIHVGSRTLTVVGRKCLITHHVTLHGCEIGDLSLIGIDATVMDGAKVGANSIVAGHSIVTEGAEFPPNSVIGGSPARLIRERDCSEANRRNADFYHLNALNYAHGIHRLSANGIARLTR